jgi:hypothetical protein
VSFEGQISNHLNGISRALNQMSHELGQLERTQLAIHHSVDEVSSRQDMTRSELAELRTAFEAYLVRDELARNLQLAHTEIIAVRQELETRFGHFDTVRRLAIGTLQGMDSGIVTQEAVQGGAEELMLTTPGYWLAPALVGLAAWIRNDQRLAERALGEALRRDNDKTSLFFALVLRRHQRNAATARWLRQYVVRQDPAALPQEFTVVLDAVATGALGPDARPPVMEQMTGWYERLSADPVVVAAQVDRWRRLVDGMRIPVDPRFTVLAQISPTWPLLKGLYEGATVHGRAEAHLRGIFDRPLRPAPGLRQRVDEILDNLVTGYDEEERPHRRKESELQALIDHAGDRTAATAAARAGGSVHDDAVDFLTLLTNAGFFPEQVGASDGTQRLAIALAKDWIVGAAGQLEAANLAALPDGVDLAVEGWAGRIDQNSSEEQLVGAVAHHIDTDTAAQVAAVRFDGRGVAAAAGAGLLLLLALVGGAQGGGGGAVLLLLMGLVLAGWAGYQWSQLQPRRQHLRALGEQRKAHACALVRGAVAETVDWRTAWEREISRAPYLRAYVAGLRREAFITTADDQGREVLV